MSDDEQSGPAPDPPGSDDTSTAKTETLERGTEQADAKPDAEPADGTAPADDPDDSASDEEVTARVTNIFHGQVLVEDGGTVGFAVGGGVRRDSGRVAEVEIEAVARLYCKPETYDHVLAVLRRRHLVILVGEEATGRSAASIMLARSLRARDTPITRLPPARTLADLSQQKYNRGQCYVLRDWIPTTTGGGSLTAYDAEQLALRLTEAGAYLVITRLAGSLSGLATATFEEPWLPPDPVALFDYCFDRVDRLDDASTALPKLRERAAQLGSARRVVQLARHLCDGVEQALLAVDDSVQRDVVAWFEANPSRRAIRAVAVLVFACRAGDEPVGAPGVGQRGFERLFARLETAEADYRDDQPPEGVEPPAETEEFPQQRHRLMTDTELATFTVEPPARPVVGVEHRPGFRTSVQRDLFLAELVRRYGDDLWSPINAWLAETIAQPVISDAHLAISYGVGRMVRYDAKEAQNSYLEQWAAGYAAERYCAVFTLWSMAAHEDLAPLALAQVRDWVWGRGAERAIVAALAFGGPLGQRYPDEAMWWLWRLAMRGQRISLYARIAIGHLLTIDAETNDPGVARYLAARVRQVLRPDVRTSQRRTALAVIVAALSVPGADGKTPAIVKVLRECPAALAPLGEIWSALLRSAPHRPEGIRVLYQTLRALENAPDGTGTAARLGQRILPTLTRAHRGQLEVGLHRLSTPAEQRRTRLVVAAFLNLPPDDLADPIGAPERTS